MILTRQPLPAVTDGYNLDLSVSCTLSRFFFSFICDLWFRGLDLWLSEQLKLEVVAGATKNGSDCRWLRKDHVLLLFGHLGRVLGFCSFKVGVGEEGSFIDLD